MIVLWNSADMVVSLELIDASGLSQSYTWEAGRSLARDMLKYLRDKLSEHGATFDDIRAIGVYRGPGSFTGLRIGLAVLNTVADANDIPIVGETGTDWRARVLERLDNAENDRLVLPEYGGEAHITKPRK